MCFDYHDYHLESTMKIEDGRLRTSGRLQQKSLISIFQQHSSLEPQDFTIAPTIAPAVIASIQLPRNQLHASVGGMGITT